MNKTLVILGNGFDLDLGLNTSFKKFVESIHFAKYSFTPLMNDILTNYRNDAKWCDIEQLFRDFFIQYHDNPSQDLFDNINNTWLMINKAWGEYLPESTERNNIKIKEDSCAYKMLQHPQTNAIWYTFNYTSPYYLAGIKDKKEPTPIHGWFVPRERTPEGLMYRIPNELVIGIDTKAIKPNCRSQKLKHIVKKMHPRYEENNFTNDLIESDNVIIFGHSMGITDCDYFYDYLTELEEGLLSHKNIFFITRDQSSALDIEKNLEKMGIKISKIEKNNKVSTIYTTEGQTNPKFIELLALL